MEFLDNGKVYSSDGKEIGHLSRVVIDPVTNRVTHVVARGGLMPTEFVIEIGLVADASGDGVRLRVRADELEDLPPFEVTHYVSTSDADADRAGSVPSFYTYPPIPDGFVTPPIASPTGFSIVEDNIPKDTVPLREGARVTASDGTHVGNVHDVIVDPRTQRATHFVITKGLIFKEQKLVPVSWIQDLTENEVRLAMGTDVLHSAREHQAT